MLSIHRGIGDLEGSFLRKGEAVLKHLHMVIKMKSYWSQPLLSNVGHLKTLIFLIPPTIYEGVFWFKTPFASK